MSGAVLDKELDSSATRIPARSAALTDLSIVGDVINLSGRAGASVGNVYRNGPQLFNQRSFVGSLGMPASGFPGCATIGLIAERSMTKVPPS